MNKTKINKDVKNLTDEDLYHNWKIQHVNKKSLKGEAKERAKEIFDLLDKEFKRRKKLKPKKDTEIGDEDE